MQEVDAAGAVAEQVDRQALMPLLGDPDHPADVGDILGDVLDVEPLALGLAAAAQVDGVDGEAPLPRAARRVQACWPPCELTPWQIATTARGSPSGSHERKWIRTPPRPAKSSSRIVNSVGIRLLPLGVPATAAGGKRRGAVAPMTSVKEGDPRRRLSGYSAIEAIG